MTDVLDLEGASGAVYRFRRVQDKDALPPEGGNYVYVKEDGSRFSILYSGVSDTLQNALDRWPEARAEHDASAIYVRLNITRSLRDREHQDIAAKATPVMNSLANA